MPHLKSLRLTADDLDRELAQRAPHVHEAGVPRPRMETLPLNGVYTHRAGDRSVIVYRPPQ